MKRILLSVLIVASTSSTFAFNPKQTMLEVATEITTIQKTGISITTILRNALAAGISPLTLVDALVAIGIRKETAVSTLIAAGADPTQLLKYTSAGKDEAVPLQVEIVPLFKPGVAPTAGGGGRFSVSKS